MVADTNPITNELQRIIATANEMLDMDIQVEKVLQVGRENPLPREKAAQLIHKIIEKIRDGATERGDRTTTAQLEGDLPTFVQELIQAGHRDGGTHSGGHIAVTPAQYWRVRMNYGRYEQLSREAWDRDEVGVWYGGWSAEDFITAQAQQDALAYLNNVSGQRHLGWEMPKSFYDTCRRFSGIKATDWVVVAFNDAIHLAQVAGGLQSSLEHPLNRLGELFKFRRIVSKKSFRLSDLPDSYRLIPMAGRGNVNQFGITGRTLVQILAESISAAEVRERIAAMSLWEWIDVLGPRGWESLCLGYLIIRETFVPSGLTVGGTLPIFDIAGRSLLDGVPIVAQCKKAPGPVAIDSEFLDACRALSIRGRAYYFAYGGCVGTVPLGITVVGRKEIEEEAKLDERICHYLDLFKG